MNQELITKELVSSIGKKFSSCPDVKAVEMHISFKDGSMMGFSKGLEEDE